MEWGTASTAAVFEDAGPIRRLPRLLPWLSAVSAAAGFLLALLHTEVFGLFPGLGLLIGLVGYVLCLGVPVGSFLGLEVQRRRMQEKFRSRFDAYDAMKVASLQKRASIFGLVLSLLPIWYVAGALGEWFK